MSDHVPPAVPATSTTAQVIARGGNPHWEQVFPHPQHGELTFKANLPRAGAVLGLHVALDMRLQELGDLSGARATTMILASALAGLELVDGITGEARMMMLPEVSREEVQGENGALQVRRVFYDAEQEPNPQFVIDVWTAFSEWRASILGELDAVKGPSGETSGSGSSTSSTAPTASPSTTLA